MKVFLAQAAVLGFAAAAFLAFGWNVGGEREDLAIEAGPGVSEGVAARAVNAALRDARFSDSDFLSDLASAAVRPERRPYRRGLGLFVDVTLGTPRELATIPLNAVCAIWRSGPVTGVRWLLDAEGREILAVSPIWGDVSCL